MKLRKLFDELIPNLNMFVIIHWLKFISKTQIFCMN